ncbi:MAG: ribonuclease P protein component [Parcubacteria group bacterium Licking1014_1]|nr:MAG: ribonuclease P protein component [Parcubacteria group bacterium Licking1014_1]
MIGTKNRLRKKRDFEAVFKKGRSFKESFLILRTAKNNLEPSRFGFIVSQKVSKKAVVRNKIKRRLREAVMSNIKNIKKGIDIVLIALPGIESKTYSETKEILSGLFKKAGITEQNV